MASFTAIVQKGYRISIPKELRKLLKIQEGSIIEFGDVKKLK